MAQHLGEQDDVYVVAHEPGGGRVTGDVRGERDACVGGDAPQDQVDGVVGTALGVISSPRSSGRLGRTEFSRLWPVIPGVQVVKAVAFCSACYLYVPMRNIRWVIAKPLPQKRTRVSAKKRRAAEVADLAVAVLRVSTQGQADSGLGIDAQREAVESFAKARDLRIVAVVEDTASGTVAPEDRPGMAKALGMLRSGEAGVLLAARADRLTRRNSDLYSLMDRGAREGWVIRTADLVVDTSSETGQLMAQVAGLFAEQERKLISARTRGALQAKKASGERLGAPLLTSEATRNRVRALRHDGLTMAQVAARLNADGITTATGRLWTWQNVRRVTASLALDDTAPGKRVEARPKLTSPAG